MSEHTAAADALARRIEEARTRMAALASDLQAVLPVPQVAALFAGPLVAILENALGSKEAAQYLRDLAAEVEQDDSGRPCGHA